MLAITRKDGDTIMIGDNIIIKVGSIQGDKVRILIDAPREVPISRGELLEVNNGNKP